ncbi:alginate O-acetyltransferase AlgX-related protein [Methylobacterium planeticum]|uniref:AlgX/AlgJ SGNH hydrolase-like domain-containing protein n=1 Tax=Methylobacterium planeticum TaxID=2615211 RepID=A0A6N6MS25_9HYPH|nr:hypothetical protein [Methylobacterium planeticum]KAB1072145.1 hypothetical protein F6X51_17105 [Methylobacterium planeticum]
MFAKRWDPVHVGRDGWLFLTGGSNRVMDHYGHGLGRWWRLRAWTRLIEARAARAAGLGIRSATLIVPEKLSVYDNLTRDLPYDPGRAPTRVLARRLARNAAYVDLLQPFRAARDGAPLYLRTDTHWSVEGYLLAYRELMRALAAVPPAEIGARPRFEAERLMDLGEKVPGLPRESVSHLVIPRAAERVHAGPLVEAYEAQGRASELHSGAHVVFRNADPGIDRRRLVLFGDSYAHFAPIMLTGLLAESFAEVHFVWSSSFDWGYIERVRPDLLVFELAERFLARVPRDDYDVAAARLAGTAGPAGAGTRAEPA